MRWKRRSATSAESWERRRSGSTSQSACWCGRRKAGGSAPRARIEAGDARQCLTGHLYRRSHCAAPAWRAPAPHRPHLRSCWIRVPDAALHATKALCPAVSPKAIGSLDAVLLSHDHHFDNLDRTGRTLLQSVPQVLTTAGGAERLNHAAV